MSDYERIASAISFIAQHMHQQPTLDEIAAHVSLSPFHFQRIFCRWAGVTPKRFLQILTLEHAKQLLSEPVSLLEVANTLGLSSSSRLHDHFIHLEAMTPGEYRLGGVGLTIEYAVHTTPFGYAFIAMTTRGICKLAFLDNADIKAELENLKRIWPNAATCENHTRTLPVISTLFDHQATLNRPLSLHVAGTNFQTSVWKALLQIPAGRVTSYAEVATAIGQPRSARAVGLAVGANPVAFLIPCHRVIRQNGQLGGYRWGATRKHAIHAWEMARQE